MQRFSYREGVLLGYSPPKTLMESSSSPDIDFNDVFGGPPRRSSIQEAQYSFGDNSESSGFRTSDEMFSASREIRLSGLGEKPVFGEEEVGRRRYSKTDFFDDIFRGNDKSSSPRKYDMKDLFAASSQCLWSSGRLPSMAEPFATSLPTRFSVLNKGLEVPTVGSPTHSRSTSRSQGGSSNDSSHYHGTKYDDNGTETKRNSKEGSFISKDGNATQFHFSIYKWENKASTIRGNDKLEGCSTSKGWIGCETAAMESKPESHHSFRSTIDRTSSAYANSFREKEDDQNGDLSSRDGERVLPTNVPMSSPEIEHSLSKIDLSDKPEKETRRKPPSKSLKSLLRDEDDHDQRGSTTRVKGSPRNSWDNGKGRVRGKVKEFIKIFNHDPSPNPVTGDTRHDSYQSQMNHDTTPKSHSSRWPERGKAKAENEPNIATLIQRDEKVHLSDMQNKKSSVEVPNANHLCKGASQKNNIIEDPRDSIDDDFLIEDLTSEEKDFPEFGIESEEIKEIDAKIQKWSNGKQGNIRSLLSTLQYVLWADSGWKPVPLVDIIEGPAVKRSYQKALLCLHPDKLQQKGAASHSKYIAEKVFDVLQDAWTHFNSLGSL